MLVCWFLRFLYKTKEAASFLSRKKVVLSVSWAAIALGLRYKKNKTKTNRASSAEQSFLAVHQKNKNKEEGKTENGEKMVKALFHYRS